MTRTVRTYLTNPAGSYQGTTSVVPNRAFIGSGFSPCKIAVRTGLRSYLQTRFALVVPPAEAGSGKE